MTTIQQSILIDAPLEIVFAFISDYTRDPLWRSGLAQIEQEPLPPSRLSTRTREIYSLCGLRFVTQAEVTSYKANSVIGFTALSSAFPIWGQRTVKPDGSAVRFTYSLTARLHGYYRFLRPLLVWQFTRQIKQDLQRLKACIESQESPNKADLKIASRLDRE